MARPGVAGPGVLGPQAVAVVDPEDVLVPCQRNPFDLDDGISANVVERPVSSDRPIGLIPIRGLGLQCLVDTEITLRPTPVGLEGRGRIHERRLDLVGGELRPLLQEESCSPGDHRCCLTRAAGSHQALTDPPCSVVLIGV